MCTRVMSSCKQIFVVTKPWGTTEQEFNHFGRRNVKTRQCRACIFYQGLTKLNISYKVTNFPTRLRNIHFSRKKICVYKKLVYFRVLIEINLKDVVFGRITLYFIYNNYCGWATILHIHKRVKARDLSKWNEVIFSGQSYSSAWSFTVLPTFHILWLEFKKAENWWSTYAIVVHDERLLHSGVNTVYIEYWINIKYKFIRNKSLVLQSIWEAISKWSCKYK